LHNLVKQFNKTHTKIHVSMQVLPWNDYRNKLLTAVTGGDAPDAAAFKLTWIPEFVGNRALEPLDDYINNWNAKGDIIENLWDVMRVTDNGKTYLLPWEMQILYMYYRPSLFKEAGISKIPQTWAEWLSVAKKLTKDTNGDGNVDQYGFGMRGTRYGHEPWGSFVFANVKGNKIMEDGKVVFNTPEAQKANEFFINLYKTEKVVPPTAPMDGFAQILANFKSGRTAMMIHHIKSAHILEEALGEDVAAFPVPAGKYGRWTSMGDTENVIFSSSKNKDAAFKFISWLSEKEQLDKWDRASGNVPVVTSLQAEDYYKNNKFMKASIESLPFAKVYPINNAMGEWIEMTWPTTTQRALEGKISPKEMMDILAKKMQPAS
jgi:multiple sugar transport system substrate-binding protein